MASQSIFIEPDTEINPIFEASLASKIDWLSVRYTTKSQPALTSTYPSFTTPAFQGYGSSTLSTESRNVPHLILYFKHLGIWREWGQIPLRPSNRMDWGLIDLKKSFLDDGGDFSIGPGGAIGCKLSYRAPVDQCVILGGASWGGSGEIASVMPIGSIMSFSGLTPPTGWLMLNGETWSRGQYLALWNFAESQIAAGNQFFSPGDGIATFSARDCRGEFFRMVDGGRGVDSGRVMGSAQLDQMQGHRHRGYHNTPGSPGANITQALQNSIQKQENTGVTGAGTPTTDGTNGEPRIGTETRSRNVAINYIIFAGEA